jgi:alpha-methylacyl-CoA racemase
LIGLRVVELANIGPSAHAAMVLADLGADVVRVQRPDLLPDDHTCAEHLHRGKRVVEVDLKDSRGAADVLALASGADVLVEGFRPGVVERLGLGPAIVLEHVPSLVYARVTGWGQDGPRADKAGHDINFIAPTGILHSIGRGEERPVPPLNVVAGFAGGSMFMVTGILSALWERQRSGLGQVVDVSAAEGAAVLTQHAWSMRGQGSWSDERGANLVDGSCPFWDTYECSDGHYMAVGAFEPQFYDRLIAVLGLDPNTLPDRNDRSRWPELRVLLAARFTTRSRAEWAAAFSDVDACVTPVSSFAEAPTDPHFSTRGSFVEIDGVVQPMPAPRFSRTPPSTPTSPPREAADLDRVWV